MEIKKIKKMFVACRKACYDPETGWTYQGYTGGNAVSLFFNNKYKINLAAGWNSQAAEVIWGLMAKA